MISMLRRVLPYVLSIPQYVYELKQIHSMTALRNWLYFKFPNLFSLPPFPPYITIELTTLCNLNCRHCWRPYSLQKRGVGSMTASSFEKIIEEINVSPHAPQVLKIGGAGEPALHHQFPEFMVALEPLMRRSVHTILYTNGALLDRFSPQEIMQWNITRLVVSVDGIDQQSYEQIRVGGSYCRLRQQVRNFREHRARTSPQKPWIEIRHVIMPGETLKHLLYFRRQWIAPGDTVKFQPVMDISTRMRVGVNTSQAAKRTGRGIRRELPIEYDGNVPITDGTGRFAGNIASHTIEELWLRIARRSSTLI